MASTSQALRVGIRIGATNETQDAINSAQAGFRGFANGLAISGMGYRGLQAIGETVDQYSSKESALARVRIMTMKVGDAHTDTYNKEVKYIEDLSSRYTGSIEDYAKMQATLLRYRMTPEDIMGGTGEAAAKLGVVFDVPAEKSAAFFGKMKNDFHVMPEEMGRLADMLSKVHRMGVGLDGADAINEMTQAFSKEGLAVRNLGMHGAKAVEDLGLLSAIFINTGQTGQSVGTNLRRILEGAMNPIKAGKVKKNALKFGIGIDFTDGHGNFGGIDHFVSELGKLKKLNTSQLYQVLDPLAGKQGLSTSMDAFMAKFGEVEFGKYKEFKDSLININDEFSVLKGTLKYITDTKNTNLENLYAAIGGSMGHNMKQFNQLIGDAATGLKHFTDEHPQVATMTVELTALTFGIGGMVGGLRALSMLNPVFGKIASGLTTAFAPILVAAAMLETINVGIDYANEHLNKTKESGMDYTQGDVNTEYYNKQIEDARSDESLSGFRRWWNMNDARIEKGMSGFGTWLFGEKPKTDFENSFGGSSAKTDLHQQEVIRKNELWNQSAAGKKYNSEHPIVPGLMYSPGIQKPTSLIYSPNIQMSGNGLTADGLDAILKKNSDNLLFLIEQAQKRKRNTTYGNA